MTKRVLDLGGGHTLRFTVNAEGERIGAIHEHPWPESPDPSQTTCSGALWLDTSATRSWQEKEGTSRPMWQIVQEEPLTLSPSIQCGGPCRAHGYIREGKWVPA